MQLDDPFPIEKFRSSARDAILLEFNGRCPSIGEVASVSDAEWLRLPGFGLATLVALRQVVQSVVRKTSTLGRLTDAELLTERDRLRREGSSLREAVHLHQHQLHAVMAELRLRNLIKEKLRHHSRIYASLT